MKLFTLLEYNSIRDREINKFIDDIADEIYDKLLTCKNELKKEEYISFAVSVDMGGKEPAFLRLFVNYQGMRNMAMFVSVPGDMGVIHLYVKTLSGKGDYYDKVVANENHIKNYYIMRLLMRLEICRVKIMCIKLLAIHLLK